MPSVAVLFPVLWLLSAGAAAAQIVDQCLTGFTHFDLCARSREVQQELTRKLPVQFDANVTLSAAAAAGARIIVTASWNATSSQVDRSLRAEGSNYSELSERLMAATKKSVCGDPILADFVQLKGKVQYNFSTLDGYVVLSPIVSSC